MKTPRIFVYLLLSLLALSPLALANGLNLNSLGSRALSMGGAFVGLADDYSAIFWNPAGMSQFTTRYLGFYGTDVIPSGSYLLQVPTQAGLLTLVDAKTQTKHYLSGLLAYYQPITENIVAGIGIYVPSGLGASWDGADFNLLSNNAAYQWESKIGAVTISPGVSYKINDMISVGAALNINYGMFSVKQWAGNTEIPEPPYEFDLGQYEMNLNGWGFGATFGVLVKINDMLSAGATLRTPNRVKLSGDTSLSNIELLGFKSSSEAKTESPHLTFPLWIAGGVAFRPLTGLTLTGDLQWTRWSALDQVELSFIDPFWSLFMIASGGNIMHLEWKDALQVRFGAEYLLRENLALRAGYYYDPTPAPDKTLNFLLPSYTFNAFTLGLGYSLNGLVIDLGFEFLAGKKREVDYAKWLLDPAYANSQPGVYDMSIVVPNISVSYKF
ncbi:MAG: outer membrane protein transport protein [Candidatus Aminicenantes bacterium]|nr:outer membrane protein transport protein [Candidatus Aminicenantes bacterium]